MIDRKIFFDKVRASLGPLDQSQVDGFNLDIDEFERRRSTVTIPFFGYMLATEWWETGKTMQPVREAFYISKDFATAEAWRRKHLRYYPYYGRGKVQLTWKDGYKRAGDELGMDFVNNPDAVMEPAISVKIMFNGMLKGWFTGKKLSDYIDDLDEMDAEDLREFTNARRIINGTDHMADIGKLALVFEHALRAADVAAPAAIPPAPPKVAPAVEKPVPWWLRFLQGLATLLTSHPWRS